VHIFSIRKELEGAVSLHDALNPEEGRRYRFGFLRCLVGIHCRERVFRPRGWSIFCWRCGKRVGKDVGAALEPVDIVSDITDEEIEKYGI
jgi:hypothetical protein